LAIRFLVFWRELSREMRIVSPSAGPYFGQLRAPAGAYGGELAVEQVAVRRRDLWHVLSTSPRGQAIGARTGALVAAL
jgi:hypothetical protein